MRNPADDKRKRASMLGLGFDCRDGEKRITKGDNFTVCGGSEETHDHMTETLIKVNEKLAKKGKRLDDVSGEEFRDLIGECSGK